ncbi:MAG: hypothetical protein HYX69_14910 [Planctomycetia bacterium]|nr:hypothetical protein [Planctomycetia bacterium]
MSDSAYESPFSLPTSRIKAVVVYCSDGRMADAVDDFAQTALGLAWHDRFVIPGGVACLAGHFEAHRIEQAVAEQLKFLIADHQLDRVVLVGHENCAYYLDRLGVAPERAMDRIREDLRRSARRIRGLGRTVTVESYLATFHGGHVRFEPVEE